MSCCDCNFYNDAFDAKTALAELKDFRKNGPKKNSLPLINSLKKLDLKNATLLDIGSGVGAIIFELVDKGITHAFYTDFSDAYHAAFLEEVKIRNLENVIRSYIGDFLETHKNIEKADLVTLDKVICCYKNYEELVQLSVQKTSKWYAYSIPRDVWWVKWVHLLKEKIDLLKGDTFRTYVHPAGKIENLVIANGFKKIHESKKREWQTVIFEKN